MSPSDRDPSFLVDDHVEQHEIVTDRRGWLTNIVAAVCMVGLLYVVMAGGGDLDDEAVDPTLPSTTLPSTTEPAPIGPFADPTIEGELIDGTRFTVTEPNPGVLCALIEEVETCHLELVTASGPGVVDDALVFGYLTPGTRAATIRYRSILPSSAGVRIEPDARFFAIPLQDDDPYRLQYRDENFDVDREVPLVAPRGGPSQSEAAATRDTVPLTIATLTFDRRIEVVAEWSALAEGPLVWSRPADGLAEQPEWSELARLDVTGTEIQQAMPLPGLQLTAQLIRPEAIYLIGEQVAPPGRDRDDRSGTAPPVALVRVDRATDDHLVRVFPQPTGTAPSVEWPGWQLGPELGTLDTSMIGVVDDVIQLKRQDGSEVLLDGPTLSPLQ